MKKRYIAPQSFVIGLSLHDGLLAEASYDGDSVLKNGGKASENGIGSADARINVRSAWEEEW